LQRIIEPLMLSTTSTQANIGGSKGALAKVVPSASPPLCSAKNAVCCFWSIPQIR